jgi:hypothetical protein
VQPPLRYPSKARRHRHGPWDPADLLAEAFTVHADRVATALEDRMRAAVDRDAALEALARHLSEDLIGAERDLVLR